MSPPIRDGSGDSIGSIRLGDGSEIAEVRTGAGDVLFSGTPATLVNRAPLDEGSGTTFTDVIGSANGTLSNGGTFTTNSAFRGDVAPTFDQSNGEGASWNPRATAPVTYTFRVRADPNGFLTEDSGHHIFSFDSVPRIFYNTSTNEWVVSDGADTRATFAESQSTLEGSIHIVTFRLDSSSCDMVVYESDAATKVGSASISNPSTSFASSTMELMRIPGEGSTNSSFGDVLDLCDVHDTRLSDSKLDSVVADVYG